jgi:membrane protease YdiL (CAAX protease family)
LVEKNRFCPKCKVKYKSTDFEFCRYCGTKLEDDHNEHDPQGEMETSKKTKHKTLASWGWKPAILGYAAAFILLYIFQNLLSFILSYTYAASFILLYIFQNLPIFQELLPYIVSYILAPYLIPGFRGIHILGSTVYVAGPELLVFITLGSYGLLVVPFLYLKVKGLPIKELGFDFSDKKEVQNDIMMGVLGGSIMMGISMLMSKLTTSLSYILYSPFDVYLSEQFSIIGNAPFMAMYSYQYILLVLSMFLIVAPCEEISTRGFLQQGLENSWGRWVGLIVTAIIFSALHLITYPQNAAGAGFPSYIGSISAILAIPSYLALSFTLGLLLQIRKYRITTTITAHAVYMTILVSLYYFLNYWVYLY